MLTPNQLSSFLKVLSEQELDTWEYFLPEKKAERYWHVQYKKSTPPIFFNIELNEELILVQVLLDEIQPRADNWLGLYRTLLQLNEELVLVKFSLDAENRFALLGELPTNNFTFEMFQNLLRLMVYYHTNLYWEIALVAEDESLARQLIFHEIQFASIDQQKQDLVKRVRTLKR